jgi:hypothetical protein
MVTVCFVHVGKLHHYEPKMVASVLKTMPEAKIIQFTDHDTPAVPGVHEVRRNKIDLPIFEYRWRAFATVKGDVACLDTDVIVQRDFSAIFGLEWDIALTRRDKPVTDENGVDITQLMPFNAGVLFSRCPEWLISVADTSVEFARNDPWYADQAALAVCVKTQPGAFLHLPAVLYNRTPKTRDEDVSKAFIVHYKGNRKEWM